MAAPKPKEPKQLLEREYIVPLRKEWLKVPKYKRANKATKALKEFLAKHMKIYDRDLRKIKIDIDLNNEIRFRGMEKPPAKIKVKATKYDDDIVRVELVDLPKILKYKRARQDKKAKEVKKVTEAKPASEKPAPKKPSEAKKEQSPETIQKEQASKEATMQMEKDKAKELKHVSKDKQVVEHRKALSK